VLFRSAGWSSRSKNRTSRMGRLQSL